MTEPVMGSRLGRLLRPQAARDFAEENRKATWLELFFDLCFVVAVAALARLLHDQPTLGGTLAFVGLFVPVWWAWMNFTWYATAFDNDDVAYRCALLGAMLCILWLAASLEGLAAGSALSFVLSYVALKVLLVLLFLRARRDAPGLRAFSTRYAIGNSAGAALWLLSLLFPPPVLYAMWAVALFVEILTPILAVRVADQRTFHPEHIPERYGLFTIIVLGESVLAVAAGTAGTGWDPEAAMAGVFGFAAAACVWWLYFDYVGSSALTMSSRAAFRWGYGHLFVYAAIAALGVGIQLAIEGAAGSEMLAAAGGGGEPAGFGAGARAILGGSAAVYLLAVSFLHWTNRRSLGDRALFARMAAAAVLAGLIVLGGALPALLFAAAVSLVLLAVTAYEVLFDDASPAP